MNQELGKSLPSGKRVPKKKTAKKANGKANGKTNWKALCEDLSAKCDMLEQEKSSLEVDLQELEEDLGDKNRIIGSMKTELVELRRSSAGGREKVVLRNLKYFHSKMVNAPLKCEADKAYVTKAVEEVSRFIREQQ